MSRPELQLLPVKDEPGEFDKTVAFLRMVWPETERLNHAYLRWLYFGNPDGSVIGMNAWSGGQIVGHYVVIPISAKHGGRRQNAALSLNTAVHPDFRGQGLFTKLAEATYALAGQMGVDHIVGVANANSTAGFTRSLRFQLVSPLAAKIVLRTPEFASASTEPAWEREWTPASLAWRLKNPAFAYTFRQHTDLIEVNGPTPYPGIRSILTITGDADASAAIRQQVREARLLRPRLWLGLGKRLCFSGAFEVPQSLRRAPLNLIYRSLSRPGEQLDPAQVEFAAIDFDVV